MRITPTAHISMAVVWLGCFSRTSGGRKPGVPARGACMWGRCRQVAHILGLPEHAQCAAVCVREGFGSVGTELQADVMEALGSGVRQCM